MDLSRREIASWNGSVANAEETQPQRERERKKERERREEREGGREIQ